MTLVPVTLWEVNVYLLERQGVKFGVSVRALPAEAEVSGVGQHGLSLLLISDPVTAMWALL